MLEPILHHYASSPFSEKVRLVLGFKGLAWRSVDVPVMLPKPDVVALTGGYRRTPFLQIGADIYCDSALMCRVFDRLRAEPPLYPDETAGLAEIVAQWADAPLFWSAIPLTLQSGGGPHILPDQSAGVRQGLCRRPCGDDDGHAPPLAAGCRRGGAHLPRAARRAVRRWPALPARRAAVHRRFLVRAVGLGSCVTRRRCRRSSINAAASRPGTSACGCSATGTPSRCRPSDALDIAAAAQLHAPVAVDAGLGFAAGDAVLVSATDYGADPVPGMLVGLSLDSVTIQRHDERAGHAARATSRASVSRSGRRRSHETVPGRHRRHHRRRVRLRARGVAHRGAWRHECRDGGRAAGRARPRRRGDRRAGRAGAALPASTSRKPPRSRRSAPPRSRASAHRTWSSTTPASVPAG